MNKQYKVIPPWQPMETAPQDGTAILAVCIHEVDPYMVDGGVRLTVYGAHAEGLTHVQDGIHVIEWGGEYIDVEYTIPPWWFRSGSDFEEVANPVAWLPIPPTE
ncbi:MAG: hypothetical protein PHY48_13700 [Candidatus Cloacimonetes bacterium]|jgi:hypothetical protein|nr:hypothetical protein [Candidatus Cloacimonadota bacterium]